LCIYIERRQSVRRHGSGEGYHTWDYISKGWTTWSQVDCLVDRVAALINVIGLCRTKEHCSTIVRSKALVTRTAREEKKAPKGGALAGTSALTPTSSRWALVVMLPCQASHGRGLGGVSR
jgi:hypothetical protein